METREVLYTRQLSHKARLNWIMFHTDSSLNWEQSIGTRQYYHVKCKDRRSQLGTRGNMTFHSTDSSLNWRAIGNKIHSLEKWKWLSTEHLFEPRKLERSVYKTVIAQNTEFQRGKMTTWSVGIDVLNWIKFHRQGEIMIITQWSVI